MADQRTMARRVDSPAEDQRDGQRTAAVRDWPKREQIDPTEDKLALPPSVVVPDGFVYERKRHSVLGKPDLAHYNRMLRGGWRPVPASRHPEIAADPDSPGGMIIQDGLVLMERPMAYNIEARREERGRAAMQVGTQMSRIGHNAEGTAPRIVHEDRQRGKIPLGLKQDFNMQVDPAAIEVE